MEIDVRKLGEAIVEAFMKEYGAGLDGDQLTTNAIRIAADAAAIAVKLYDEMKNQ